MKEQWSITENTSVNGLVDIVSNQSNWFVAESLTRNNAITIITHFNSLGRVKIDKNGDPE